MIRGIAHLLAYRFIRLNLVPEVYELHRFSRVIVFMLTNYALYVQVSGQFHLITGILHLFGWNLSKTHNCYFLASSFSDIWRRINIYWKDFLAKLVFYPAFYALRGRGAATRPAMILSSLLVFVATWLLHSWQTFWLLGRFPLTVNDACLWLGAGVAVAVNIAWESRQSVPMRRGQWVSPFRRAVQIVLMQLTVSLFWACWTKPGFFDLVWRSLCRPEAVHEMTIVLRWMLVTIAAGTVLARYFSVQSASTTHQQTGPDFGTSIKLHLAILGIALVVASPLSETLLPTSVIKSLAELRKDPMTADREGERLLSYYEDLNQAVIQAGPIIRALSPQQTTSHGQAEGFAKVSRRADLYQDLDLIPGISTEIDGNAISINQFGMRSVRTPTLDKPAGTIRVALVGSSIVMGYGVADDEAFCQILETELNQSLADKSHPVEVLNFGVGKQWAPHRLVRIQRKVLAFQPDALFYFAHQDELRELASHSAQLIVNHLELPSNHLKAVVNRAKVTADMAPGAIQTQLQRHETELLAAIYHTIVDECQSRKIVPVWIYLPVPSAVADDVGPKVMKLATEAGFIVCELSDWATNPEGLFRSADDPHPTAKGHERIAAALLRMLDKHPEILPAVKRVPKDE